MSGIFIILVVAISLSMDTFSLSMAYGLLNLEKEVIMKTSIIVGVFHFFMPMLGNLIGEYILKVLPFNSSLIIGFIFLILSIQIFFSLFKGEEVETLNGVLSIIFFAFTVSIDSFSICIGLNAISKNHLVTSSVFLIISTFFTYLGLTTGKKIFHIFGKKTQLLGMILLLILSINYIIKGC